MKSPALSILKTYWLNNLWNYIEDHHLPEYRFNQILNWVFQKNTYSYQEMTNIPRKMQEELAHLSPIIRLNLVSVIHSEDGETHKWLFKCEDGNCIESVLIQSDNRNTLCISSQTGCVLGCAFCATAQKKPARNLLLSEILSQFLIVQKSYPLTNLVFMGMGEPLLNRDNCFNAIRILNDEDAGKFGIRRITISTAGIIPGIEEFAKEFPGARLAVSLNSAIPEKRIKIMPIEKKYPLPFLIKALQDYQKQTGNRITMEYVMLKGFNTNLEDAQAIIELYHSLKFNLNLIPHNDHPDSIYQRPNKQEIKQFKEYFNNSKVPVVQRYLKGSDICAACGQLKGELT